MDYKLQCYACGYYEDSDKSEYLCPKCNSIRILFISKEAIKQMKDESAPLDN